MKSDLPKKCIRTNLNFNWFYIQYLSDKTFLEAEILIVTYRPVFVQIIQYHFALL